MYRSPREGRLGIGQLRRWAKHFARAGTLSYRRISAAVWTLTPTPVIWRASWRLDTAWVSADVSSFVEADSAKVATMAPPCSETTPQFRNSIWAQTGLRIALAASPRASMAPRNTFTRHFRRWRRAATSNR